MESKQKAQKLSQLELELISTHSGFFDENNTTYKQEKFIHKKNNLVPKELIMEKSDIKNGKQSTTEEYE